MRVYMDVSNSDLERIQLLEATALEHEEMRDYFRDQMLEKEEMRIISLIMSERIRLLTKELNDKAVEVVSAVSNAHHFIRKLSARDGKIRQLKAELDETQAEIEELRSGLQHSLDEVNSHKQDLRRQLRNKEEELEKICSSAARAIGQMNARDKTIRQLQAELKKKEEAWNNSMHDVMFVFRFLYSFLQVLLLFLWIFDYGCEEQARRTVLNMLTAVVSVHGLILDSNPALKTLTTAWAVMVVSLVVVDHYNV